MNTEKFNWLVDNVCSEIKERLCKKAEEYAKDKNRLHNFHKAAAFREITPEEALAGMKVKHQVSIDDMLQNLAKGKTDKWDKWWEKVIDDINYDILLLGLVYDRLDTTIREDKLKSITKQGGKNK